MSLLCSNQYGFLKDHSIFRALLDMQVKILDSTNNHKISYRTTVII